MLDTGGHRGQINAITFTADGEQLISASEDKTIRVWNLATGRTVRIFRGDHARGSAGDIYGIALSPDGQWLAAGGRTRQNEIRLYDFSSGQIRAVLKGHSKSVLCLAFSPDGRYLISGSWDRSAIIWDIEKRQALHRLSGHRGKIHAVGFTPDSARAVTGSYDHDLKLWRVTDGDLIAEMSGHRENVRTLAVSQTGIVASGDLSGEIRLWDGETGRFCRVLAQQNAEVGSLSFSPDSNTLLSGPDCSPYNCYVYDVASGRLMTTYANHDDSVLATAISPDGHWAATGGGDRHEIHLWKVNTGAHRLDPQDQILTLGGRGDPVWAVGFGADGRSIAWGNRHLPAWKSNDIGPLEHVLELPSTTNGTPQLRRLDDEPAAESFRRATVNHHSWALSRRKRERGKAATLDIARDDETVASVEDGPSHCAFSFALDGKIVISGCDCGVTCVYDRQGNRLGSLVGHEGRISALAPSPDGRLLLSGATDQTVRLWNVHTRELLVTLFHDQDEEWVMWTPQGYYIASENGDALIGWQINYGPALTPGYVEARQLARRLYRPDIVARTIELASAKAAIAELGAPVNVIDSLRTARPPQFRFVRPEHGASVNASPVAVLMEFAPNPDPLADVRITVNGRQIAARDTARSMATAAGPTRSYSVPLQRGHNDIRVVAVNNAGETPGQVSVSYSAKGLDKRGVLYVIAVGVNEYEHYPEAKLRFASKDARDFLAAMRDFSGPLHSRIEARLLVKGEGNDREPTAENVTKALRLFRRAVPEDTVVLFLAGHGTSELTDSPFRIRNMLNRAKRQGDYLFLAQNSKADSEGWLPKTVVKWPEIQLALHNAKGLRLLFVDTCHAHGAYDPRLVQEAGAEQIVVFAATDRGLPAYEDPEFRNGTFTLALTQGLSGRAAQDQEGNIGLGALQQYVHDQMRSLSDGNQTPMFRNTGGRNFVIAKRNGT